MGREEFQLLLNPKYYPKAKFSSEVLQQEKVIKDLFVDFRHKMQGESYSRIEEIPTLINELLISGHKDFLVWDDMLKGAEMEFVRQACPLQHPVADICCGYGYWISKVVKGIDVGIDLFGGGGEGRQLYGIKENHFADNAYKSVLRADVTKTLPLPDSFFKTMLCICALEHIHDLSGTLTVLRSSLANDGRLLLTVQTKRFMDIYKDIFSKEYFEAVVEEHQMVNNYDPPQWESVLLRHGFYVRKKYARLSPELVTMYALMFYPGGGNSVLKKMNFHLAYNDSESFRKSYMDFLLSATTDEVPEEEAGLMLYECVLA